MIVDSIERASLYRSLSPRIAAALDYCAEVAAAGFDEKTVELDGRTIYAMHQSYATDDGSARAGEAHRRYIDIQYILEGEETIRVADSEGLATTKPYDAEKDVEFFAPYAGTDLRLGSGDFAILWPHEAHFPKLASAKPAAVKKVVVKVLV